MSSSVIIVLFIYTIIFNFINICYAYAYACYAYSDAAECWLSKMGL